MELDLGFLGLREEDEGDGTGLEGDDGGEAI